MIANAASYHEGITVKLVYPVRCKYARGVKTNLQYYKTNTEAQTQHKLHMKFR